MLLWALYWLAAAALAALLYLVIAGFFMRRRKLGHLPELAVALFLVACAGSSLSAGRDAVGHSEIALAYWALSPILFLLYFYLFSDSRFVPRGTRWWAVLFGLSQVGQLFGASSDSTPKTSPVVQLIPSLVLNSALLFGDALVVVFLILGVVPQVYARRRQLAELAPAASAPWSRLAMAAGAGVVLVVIAGVTFTQPFGNEGGILLFLHTLIYLATTLLPVPLAFALLNVRPYDRQAIAWRVVDAGALLACLITVYAITCVLVSLLTFPLIDQSSLPFAILAAGLVTAGLFRPLRAWLRPRLERWLFPLLHQERRVLAEVSQELSGEIQMDALCDRVMDAVRRGLQPESAVLWVRSAPSLSALAMARLLPAGSQGVGQGSARTSRPTLELQPRRTTSNAAPAPAPSTLLIAPDDPIRLALPVGVGAVPVARLPRDSRAAYGLKAAGAVVALSLVSEDDLLGVLALGPRQGVAQDGAKDAPSYSADECELLDGLARCAAPALRVALMVHEQDSDTRARERVEQELRTARRIQQTLLPREIPALDGWHLDVYYEPAREVGGDFYDFLPFTDGRLGIVLGDVTDKGVPAALVMATTRSMLRAVALESTPPGAVLARVNELLYADLPASMFVTCFYGILDPASGRMRFANAGQDLPYLRDARSQVREVHATGMPLGLMPGMAYEENEVEVLPGDGILFYSDGLVEAHDPRRAMFGFPRLSAYLGGDLPAEGPIAGLLGALAAFTGADWEQEDDITLVALRRRP